jgi:hypothetical protein
MDRDLTKNRLPEEAKRRANHPSFRADRFIVATTAAVLRYLGGLPTNCHSFAAQ